MPPIWHRRQWTVLALLSIYNTCTSYTQQLNGTASASYNFPTEGTEMTCH